ncbi:MAG TPA: hypothetical protein PKC18_04445 [Lacipirellulaceae bacterium]|nr:hypothetical protein [Lacipirellulaceae bacterium]HMP07572.1 hypothetical protein [Lacipirellulaceae bacterium]
MNIRPEMMEECRALLVAIEAHLQRRLSGRVGHVKVVVNDDAIDLQGRAQTYYTKQIAQQAVMEVTTLPIRVNDIQVPGRS